MTVTVLPIIEPETKPAVPLAKVMNERLKRLAGELQEQHLKDLKSEEPMFDDVVIYISYNSKYSIRWKIVNDVPENISNIVNDACDKLGYIKWKAVSLYNFNGKS
ncbi:MAG TPA: hypothetical protein VKB19_15680 [Pedobacter sp.]|nr:hypothetical protein [Pedobacter sp.]